VLVAAARRVFEATPYAETRISDITAEAGVASGTFYTYFDSKEAIFREVASEVLAEMNRAPTRRRDDAAADPIAAIEEASRRYFLSCLRNAGVARSIEHLVSQDQAVAAERRSTVVSSVRRAERWIRNLQRRGICDDAIDPWTTAMALHTMTVRVAYDHLLLGGGGGDDVDGLARTVSHIWARTVGLEQVRP
jgi:AcrR family transcriptional regulator